MLSDLGGRLGYPAPDCRRGSIKMGRTWRPILIDLLLVSCRPLLAQDLRQTEVEYPVVSTVYNP